MQAEDEAEAQAAVSIQPWGGRRANEALERTRTVGRARNLPCFICRLPIDYDLRWPDKMSCTVQHIISRFARPDLTWVPSNWAPAHLTCNSSAGTGAADPYDLGATSL